MKRLLLSVNGVEIGKIGCKQTQIEQEKAYPALAFLEKSAKIYGLAGASDSG
ncbi:MAG: hypothetical protein LBJ31_09520 [Treponema sp.]|jgi:hypothetical protein|nr:hypothetical protein [Treponema sp.]